jgi:eukaryotic-like serine/threonine-protein kinase
MAIADDDRQSEPGLEPGSVIAGRFRVERKLGEGGMGAVYSAVNITTSRAVALKVMHPEHAMKKDIVRRFMREAKAATVITHPNVIEVFDVVEADSGEPVMVMELLRGEPLDALLQRQGALPLGDVARIMAPVISAVGAAHARGIVHRDLKPENVFLSTTGHGAMKPKVLDFGIAKILDPAQINEVSTKSGGTRTGSMLGTPFYMSIEQACGEKDIDHRADIWSIGVMLYVMLSGRRPYEGENYGQILRSLMTSTPTSIATLVTGLPGDIVDIVERCMARSRKDRPADLREVYCVLTRYCEATGSSMPPIAPAAGVSRDAASQTLAAASVNMSNVASGGITQLTSRRTLWLMGAPAIAILLGTSAFWFTRYRSTLSVGAVADPTTVASAPAAPSSSPPAQPAEAPFPSALLSAEPSSSGSSRAVGLAAASKAKPKESGAAAAPGAAKPADTPGSGIIMSNPYQ